MSKIYVRIMSAYNRSTLDECIKTEEPITFETFMKLLESGLYMFTGYDSRLKADRYLLRHADLNLGLPTWLHRYDSKEN